MEIKTLELSLEGLKLLISKPNEDTRGFFWECYREPLYKELGITETFLQDNHSFSKRGTLRGMHFQRRPGQAKLISVLEGEIFDVAVDIRPHSPTFGKWQGVTLSPGKQLFIPIGFAHGFCAMSDKVHVTYKVSSIYDPQEETGFSPLDPEVGIQWPNIDGGYLLSPRDEKASTFQEVVLR